MEDKKLVKIECSKNAFEDIEALLFSQSYTEKPENIDRIEINCDGDIYQYSLGEEFGMWYIFTE